MSLDKRCHELSKITTTRDLKLVGGDFFDPYIPKEYQFLEHYFPTEKTKVFLRYFIAFRNTITLVDHTGVAISKKFLEILKQRFKVLVKLREEAKANDDVEKLAEIDSGRLLLKNYKLTRHPNHRDRTRNLNTKEPDLL